MKRLKALFMSLVLATCALGTSSSVNAATYSTGKAVIPWYYQTNLSFTSFSISNITDAPIQVTVTLYNEDGTLLVDDNNQNTGRLTGTSQMINYNDQNLDSSVTFTLNAHSTGILRTAAGTSTAQIGYGMIKWDQNSSALQGLVCIGHMVENLSNGAQSRESVIINGSLPF